MHCPRIHGLIIITGTTAAARAFSAGPQLDETPAEYVEAGRGLCPSRRLELDDQVGRDPASVTDLDALALGPLADL